MAECRCRAPGPCLASKQARIPTLYLIRSWSRSTDFCGTRAILRQTSRVELKRAQFKSLQRGTSIEWLPRAAYLRDSHGKFQNPRAAAASDGERDPLNEAAPLSAGGSDVHNRSVGESAELFCGVKAYFIARNIDTVAVCREYSQGSENAPKQRLHFHRDHAAIQLPDSPATSSKMGEQTSVVEQAIVTDQTSVPEQASVAERWLLVFGYGSVAFFNVEEEEIQKHLAIVRANVQEPRRPDAIGMTGGWMEVVRQIRQRFRSRGEFPRLQNLKHMEGTAMGRLDDYAVKVRPGLPHFSEQATDAILIRHLDEASVQIVGSVLAQSVALEYHVAKVDALLAVFRELNLQMEVTGDHGLQQTQLLRLAATSNSILADVMVNLKILDRYETAWKLDKYSALWEAMRGTFEVVSRFENLRYKLQVVQANVEFFVEVLRNDRGEFLELTIIALIVVEVFLGVWNIVLVLQGH